MKITESFYYKIHLLRSHFGDGEFVSKPVTFPLCMVGGLPGLFVPNPENMAGDVGQRRREAGSACCLEVFLQMPVLSVSGYAPLEGGQLVKFSGA